MQETQAQTRRWRWGVNRWIVLLLIILGVVAASIYPPVRPHIQLAAEKLREQPLVTLPVLGEIYLTNTLVATLLADLVLILIAVAVRRAVGRGGLVLEGLSGAVEAMLEALYDLTEQTAGKWAKRIFPWMATIVLLVLVANWMELIPTVDSVGLIEHAPAGVEGHPVEVLGTIGNTEIVTIVPGEGGESASGELYTLVPFVRVASTDLNFTIALALISVFMTQVFGIRALGLSYFQKFLNFKALLAGSFVRGIDFLVGLLEALSEFTKVLSFSFRLFGNIFAGSVLLFVVGSLVPVFAQSIFLILEFFVGVIQAIVFGMLTLVFMAQATTGHEHGEEEAY